MYTYGVGIKKKNVSSPSTLDRLNGLLEPGGVLTIGERGSIDGHIETVEPHPDFRLVLTINPRHGGISRAMRNRGVEIHLLDEVRNRTLNVDTEAIFIFHRFFFPPRTK